VDTASVTVDFIPDTKVEPKDTSICEGDSVTLTASGAPDYIWNTGPSSASITVAPSNSTSYNVTGVNGSCTGNTVFTKVTVDQPPVAQANANDTVVALVNGATVHFDNGGSTGASFAWDFGDGTSANTPDTSHSYGTVGTYDVVLTAYMNGCTDRDTITVHVNEENTALRENDAAANNVEIYPNPSSGRFHMEASFSEKQDLEIEVINSVGKTLRERSIDDVRKHQELFDLSDRSTGIYYVRIRNANGVSVHKVSVMR
jgi:PKD repeat protein